MALKPGSAALAIHKTGRSSQIVACARQHTLKPITSGPAGTVPFPAGLLTDGIYFLRLFVRVRDELLFARLVFLRDPLLALLAPVRLPLLVDLALPFAGIFTPARRAFDKPIATACLRDLTGCLPFLACSISSLTNSPAWVLGDLPSFRSWRARRIVLFDGI
jgi:hypothetical protein